MSAHVVNLVRPQRNMRAQGRDNRRRHPVVTGTVLSRPRRDGLLNLATTPIIYSLLLPLVLIDVWVTAYQRTCFPIYRIDPVRRRRYFAFDRHTLAYLNAIEKIHCTFCAYANGVIAYVREVAARTEQYWCPIKHARTPPASHGRYGRFAEFDDDARYHEQRDRLRRALRRQTRQRGRRRDPDRRVR